MSELRLPFVTFTQQCGADRELIGVLGFPGLLRVGANASERRHVRSYWETQIQELEPQAVWAKIFPDSVQVRQTQLRLAPPDVRAGEWNDEFSIPIHYLFWPIAPQRWIAFAPNFSVYAVADRESELAEAVQTEVRAVLTRFQATKRLSNLFAFSHLSGLQVQVEPVEIKLPTPKQRHDSKSAGVAEDDTLGKVAKRLLPGALEPAFLLEPKVAQLAELLGNRLPSSVLLVGASGVGKTSAFHELVRTANVRQMGNLEFWRTDGSSLIAGMSGFGQWQERCQKLVAALSKKKSVLHLGNLIELAEVGRGGSSTTGIADFLLPLIGQGKILAVVECTPEQLSLAEKQNPRILDAFTRIEFSPPTDSDCAQILAGVAALQRPAQSSPRTEVSRHAIRFIEQLHRRFAKYSPMPGRAIGFLKNLILDHGQKGTTIDVEDVISAFSKQTGLPKFLLSQTMPLDIPATQAWFQQRLIGQAEPIDLMVDAVAAVKTNLSRPGRPIGSFLFIGPTGVGKTEMAKAIAAFMFGDSKRLVRIDMSEFHHPLAVARLIGAMGSGDGVLTNKVRENPFSVLLLDEIEKADASVFDLLLQVLGEGRLTDGRGQTTDFTNSIVILTSNLGVESYRASGLGFQATASGPTWREHFQKKVEQFFRPEFVNRLDRIVPFAPLELDSIKKIAAREMDLIRQRLGIADRPLTWDVSAGALNYLAQAGYDPRYGARPLKRVLTRQLIRPLARELNGHANAVPLRVEIDGTPSGLRVAVTRQGKHLSAIHSHNVTVDSQLQKLAVERRRAQSLAVTPIVVRLRNECFRLRERLNELDKQERNRHRQDLNSKEQRPRLEPRRELGPVRGVLERRRQELESVLHQIDELVRDLRQYEQALLHEFYSRQELDPGQIAERSRQFAATIDQQVFRIFLSEHKAVDRVHILMFGRSVQGMQVLCSAYEHLAKRHGLECLWYSLHRITDADSDAVLRLGPAPDEANPNPRPNVAVVRKPQRKALIDEADGTRLGYALSLRGEKAWYYFGTEFGIHRWKSKKNESILVETSAGRLIDHHVPPSIESLPEFDSQRIRRRYNLDDGTLVDPMGDYKETGLSNFATWTEAIANAVEQSFLKHLNQTVELWT
ncbi:MAG: AAA family ATPase [Planctomycetaceae bacterium]|nr:AAA family ATPase [Planctomycetaceae bacterium]